MKNRYLTPYDRGVRVCVSSIHCLDGASEFENELYSYIKSVGRGKSVSVDFSSVESIGRHAGVGILVHAIGIARKQGVNLKFEGIGKRVSNEIKNCRLGRVFGIE